MPDIKIKISCINFLMVISLLVFVSCEKTKPIKDSEIILVNIDDKVSISLNEFIRRAEYTIRPAYCKQNKYIQKKIILNSLIAEKLYALEVGEKNPINEHDGFKRYIKGRKEQAMRQLMFHEYATKKVNLDSTLIQQFYSNANREYEIEYFSISEPETAAKFSNEIMTSKQFDSLYFRLNNGANSIPSRILSWGSHESGEILKYFYQSGLSTGEVLKPIEVSKNEFMFFRVTGWNDTKSITEKQIIERWNDVSETLTKIEAAEIWSREIRELMKGKSVKFNGEVAEKVKKIFFEKYFTTDDDKKEFYKEKLFDQEIQINQTIDEIFDNEEFLAETFFELDGKAWTVGDFRNELKSHPLVFRKLRIPSDEFGKQFKYAIIDLMEDHFVTKKAYERGYDKAVIVQRNENMWKDSFLAGFHKNIFLSSQGETRNFSKDHIKIIEERLNPYLEQIQKKYYKKIKINFEEFEKIQLATIDLYVKQPGQPYKMVVPIFPTLTTNHYLGYAAKL